MNKGHVYERTPQVSRELIEWLEEQFPLKSPDLNQHERAIFYAVGQRSVVDHLAAVFKEQNETILESP